MAKIRTKQELSASEMETVSYSSRLQDIYNNRWWNVELATYFVQFNMGKEPMRAGE